MVRLIDCDGLRSRECKVLFAACMLPHFHYPLSIIHSWRSLRLCEKSSLHSRLLDRSMVLYGTCMGSANSHANTNLPALLAGGGLKHGKHLAFDPQNNYPLTNLFVSMLQRLGIETNEFSTGLGTFRGLEAV